MPFAYQGQRPLYFEAQDFRILAWSPRFLITRCQRGSLKLLIVVCHAPTRADKDRDRWWKEFVDKVISVAKGDQVVVLGDLNVRFTAPLEPHVGDLCWEKEEEVPVQLLRLLQVLQLWAPSTYTACHTGLSHTWASPGHGILSRLDYVLVPLGWPVLPSASKVLHEVDFGQKGIDHFAVQLDVTVAAWDSVAAPRRSKRIDIARLKDTSSSQVVREICDAAPEVPWSVDVHTHCDLVTRHLVDFLAAAFSRDRAPRRRKFFSDTTWNFRQQRTALRRLVHKGIGWFRGFEERWAFTIWRAESGFASTGVKLFATLLGRVKAVAAAIVGLKDLKPLLRRSLCRDKAAYLRGIAQEAARALARMFSRGFGPFLGLHDASNVLLSLCRPSFLRMALRRQMQQRQRQGGSGILAPLRLDTQRIHLSLLPSVCADRMKRSLEMISLQQQMYLVVPCTRQAFVRLRVTGRQGGTVFLRNCYTTMLRRFRALPMASS